MAVLCAVSILVHSVVLKMYNISTWTVWKYLKLATDHVFVCVQPPPEFVIALYEHVRERGILNFVPELIHLTSKVISHVFQVILLKILTIKYIGIQRNVAFNVLMVRRYLFFLLPYT